MAQVTDTKSLSLESVFVVIIVVKPIRWEYMFLVFFILLILLDSRDDISIVWYSQTLQTDGLTLFRTEDAQ